jgi:hypothetical protein
MAIYRCGSNVDLIRWCVGYWGLLGSSRITASMRRRLLWRCFCFERSCGRANLVYERQRARERRDRKGGDGCRWVGVVGAQYLEGRDGESVLVVLGLLVKLFV